MTLVYPLDLKFSFKLMRFHVRTGQREVEPKLLDVSTDAYVNPENVVFVRRSMRFLIPTDHLE